MIGANDQRPTAPTRHGAYLCLRPRPGARHVLVGADVPALVERLGLTNEFGAAGGHPREAVAYLRRVGGTPWHIADDGLLHAEAVVHVAAPTAERVERFCAGLDRLVGQAAEIRVLGGEVRGRRYTSEAMHDFAYAHQVLQHPGATAPNAFLVPVRKTAAWWKKSWLERHTYFLPRYDKAGRMLNEGHALAAAAGIPCLMRRTYRHPTEPAGDGAYDFVSYFECADEDAPTFHAVCTALRDVARNPEWAFVREGPTWQGRRVATWAELFA